MTPLNRQVIINSLKNKETPIYVVDDINSTNDFFNPAQNFATPSVCLAEKQSAARGRLQRKWYMPPYQNLSLSLVYRFKKDINGLNLVAGLAARKAIEENLANASLLKVKWPNDVIYSGEKIAGILIESKIIHEFIYVVTGIGINVNMDDDQNNINRSWTSLKKIIGKEHDRNVLAAQVIDYLLQYYQIFETHGLDYFIKYWHNHDFLTNQNISVTENSEVSNGKYMGINSQGMLGLEPANGTVKWLNYGDASVRPIIHD